MSGVPNVFGSATSSIPLSQLDVNFNTPLYIGNTSVGLGNTVTSFGNVTLTNTTISGLSGSTANGVVYINSSNVAVASPTVLSFTGTNLGVGTSSPQNALVVSNSGAAGIEFVPNYTGLATGPAIYSYNRSGSAWTPQSYLATSHYWGTGSNPAAGATMVLDNSGCLLINGTSNPGNNYKLLVANGGFFGLGVTASNTVYMSSLGTGLVYSNGGFLTSTNPSDKNLKTNITNLTWGLTEINKLKPVSYNWKTDTINQGTQYGFIAQDVQTVIPDLIKSFKAEDGNEYLGLEKEGIYVAMVKAIQELSAQVTALQAKVGI